MTIDTARLRQSVKKAKCSRTEDGVWEYEIHPSALLELLDELEALRDERGLAKAAQPRKYPSHCSGVIVHEPGKFPVEYDSSCGPEDDV